MSKRTFYNNQPNDSTPQYLNQQQLEELAKDERNRVYTYTHDAPTATYTASQQASFITAIRRAFVQLKKEHPDWTDVQIRTEIRNRNAEVATFADNNTRIFDLCTGSGTTEQDLNRLNYMLYLRSQQESGALNEIGAQEMIQNYLIQEFKTNMSIEEYKKKCAEEKAAKTAKKPAAK